jgi:hypothetical protein
LRRFGGINVKELGMKVETIYNWMTRLIESVDIEQGKDYSDIWDDFWALNRRIPVFIDYYDPDTSYEEDIMARYNAIGEYLGKV